MSDEFGSVQEATMHVRRADARWQAAVHGFDPYPDRLRRLAEAAEGERRALLFAELCNVKWKPQPGARGLRLAAELDPGTRIGPEKLWAKFDKALDDRNVSHHLVTYPGAPHSFFDRTFAQYEKECADAWRRALGFMATGDPKAVR